jgi:hypothetical protein
MRWLVTLALLVAIPHPADACCEPDPLTATRPRSWTVLPPNPRILAFVPGPASQRITANAPFDQRLVDDTHWFHVYELRFEIDVGTLIVEVPTSGSKTTRASFPISVASANHAQVTAVDTKISCNDIGIALDIPGNAIAARVDWHDGGAATWPEIWDDTPTLKVFIGSAMELRSFTLVALFADGTDRVLGTSSMRYRPFDGEVNRRPLELLDTHWPMLAGPWLPERAPTVRQPSPFDVDDPRPRGLLAVGLLLALVAWQFRGRVRTSSGADYVRPCSWR